MGSEAFDKFFLLGPSGALKVNLQYVGQGGQTFPRIVGDIVVERKGVAADFQPLASSHYQVIRLDSLQHLDHGLFGRQQRDAIFQQQLASAVDKRPLAITKHVKPHEQGAIEGAAGGCFGIVGAKDIFDPVPKQQFIAKHMLFPVQDGLSCHKSEELFATVRNGLNAG